jgi:hypothetical protein
MGFRCAHATNPLAPHVGGLRGGGASGGGLPPSRPFAENRELGGPHTCIKGSKGSRSGSQGSSVLTNK